MAQTAESERHVQSVTELTARLKHQLESNFPAQWVTGEVSNLARPNSGHYYFTLKDENSQLRAVMWRSTASRLKFQLEEGQAIVCCGDIDLYIPRGTYQLVCRLVEPAGEGAMQIAFRQLHRKLQAEGLFDPGQKQPLPRIPQRIGLITSPSGAAIHDFCQVVKRRWPMLKILVIPCRVQGKEAADEVVSAIRMAQNIQPHLDVLVVTRGGGSIEDLWTFNEEAVVRAVRASRIPTLSAIGHEIDLTLCDLAADVRALTPSEAGEKLVPNRLEWRDALDDTVRRLARHLLHGSQLARNRVDSVINRRIFRSPQDWLEEFARGLDQQQHRFTVAAERALERQQDRIEHLATRLNAVSPLNTLARGYSVTLNRSGQVIRSTEDVQMGDEIVTRLQSGTLHSRLERTTNS